MSDIIKAEGKLMKILILGSGRIGSTIAKLLFHSGDFHVTLASRNAETLKSLSVKTSFDTVIMDVDKEEIFPRLKGFDLVISALSFYQNVKIARSALKAGISYFDLTEDRETTKVIMEIAKEAKAGQIFMPQCGLAPGFIDILGYGLSRQFDKIRSIKMRVGALPLYPTNQLKYNLSWSTDGLINEYCKECEIIHDGKKINVLPLEGMEHFSLDGVEYEAFNTSGGLGTLCSTLQGKVEEMSYKTVRYKGHRFLIDFLLNGLQMKNKRTLLKELLESSIPMSTQDLVLIFCAVNGWIDGQLRQVSYATKLYHKKVYDEEFSAIQISTAAGICTAVDLFREGKLPSSGFIRQENIDLEEFLNNRFGTFYKDASPLGTIMQELS